MTVDEFEAQGVVVLRGVFREWVDGLARGVDEVMAEPSLLEREVTLECVAGSHRWSKVNYRPKRFNGMPLYSDVDFVETPDIESERRHLQIVAWAMEPGDAVAFNFRTLHGAPAHTEALTRRVADLFLG